jgi:hypothetical protein
MKAFLIKRGQVLITGETGARSKEEVHPYSIIQGPVHLQRLSDFSWQLQVPKIFVEVVDAIRSQSRYLRIKPGDNITFTIQREDRVDTLHVPRTIYKTIRADRTKVVFKI